MANYTILKNADLFIDLPIDFSNQGWVVSDNKAYHSGCNSGYIEKTFDLSSGTQWSFTYTILSVTTGSINIVVDGVNGISRTTAGVFTETFNVTGTNKLVRFFSTGENSLELVKIYPTTGAILGTTLAFNEDADRFTTRYSFVPELMNKFINSFFTFKDGGLWEHNVNPIRNNFYGEQFTSQIVFYCNLSPSEVKNFHSLREKSNKVWSVTDIEIPARYGKPDGQRSRLKKGRFKHMQGDWFADFLKDLNDPRFNTELDALLRGADLQGNIMKISIENDETVEVRLTSIDVLVSLSQYTY